MTLHVLIFDLDQTLADEGVVYPGLRETLRELKEQGYRLFVCSFNPYAEWFTNRQCIREYFEQVIVNLDQEKGETIVQLLAEIGATLEETLFFEDDRNNVAEARAYGVRTYEVPCGGLTPQQVWDQVSSTEEN
jgi:HAD superfamily hydrolase (TIGR01509 family)